MLADLAADVVKVEVPPGGDLFRTCGRPPTPISPLFANCNRGKRSVALDLKQPGAVDQLLGLVAESDVWLSNWRTGVADRLGLGDDVLAAANERLIRIYVTGYGTEGPNVGSPVFDLIVQAASGLTYATVRDGAPQAQPGFVVDKITAMMASQAALAALYARSRSGRGERVDVSMLAAASYVNFVELFANRTFLDSAPEDPLNRHALSGRVLPAEDGWLAVAPVSGQAIRRACEAVGHPEWVAEMRQVSGQAELQKLFYDLFATVLPTRPAAHWLKVFAEHDVPASLCLTMDDHLADPQVEAQEIYRTTTWPEIGEVRTVRYPGEFASVGRIGAVAPPPAVGQDNDELLAGRS
jgi:crotonobetainyl-CoA:carnitine CoA-transferase CaiB-like acyl-CoA transferase